MSLAAGTNPAGSRAGSRAWSRKLRGERLPDHSNATATAVNVTCTLNSGGDSDFETTTVPPSGGSSPMTLQALAKFAGPGTVTLTCTGPGPGVQAAYVRITMTQVGRVYIQGKPRECRLGSIGCALVAPLLSRYSAGRSRSR